MAAEKVVEPTSPHSGANLSYIAHSAHHDSGASEGQRALLACLLPFSAGLACDSAAHCSRVYAHAARSTRKCGALRASQSGTRSVLAKEPHGQHADT